MADNTNNSRLSLAGMCDFPVVSSLYPLKLRYVVFCLPYGTTRADIESGRFTTRD